LLLTFLAGVAATVVCTLVLLLFKKTENPADDSGCGLEARGISFEDMMVFGKKNWFVL
jgi:hypothetical protein